MTYLADVLERIVSGRTKRNEPHTLQVEFFFKWIKQHLRLKAFYRISESAVKTQNSIVVSV